MKRYRKLPIVIEAAQFHPEQKPWPPGVVRLNYQGVIGYAIETLEGNMFVSPGDFIIRGVMGELYPCKPDIFQATYEAVDD